MEIEKRPFKPFKYPFCFEAYKTQNRIHWRPSELNYLQDKKDFEKCSEEDKQLILDIFSFFTQSDIEVNESYQHFDDYFRPYTEVSMMLSAFANAECIHIDAYSHLIETLNIDESIYTKFKDNEFLKLRYDLSQEAKKSSDFIGKLIYNHLYLEGISLFGMFALLLHFNRNNKFQSMGQVITWSMRDETLHVTNMIHLLSIYVVETNNELYLTRSIELLKMTLLQEEAYLKTIIKDELLLKDITHYMSYLTDNITMSLIKTIQKLLIEYPSRLNNFTKEALAVYNLFFTEKFETPKWIHDASGLENVNYFKTTDTSYLRLDMNEELEIDF